MVVGGGMAAQHLVDRLVELGAPAAFEITVLSEELHAPYDRVHLGSVLSGSDPHSLRLRDPEWYARAGIRLRLKERVAGLHLESRCVETTSGERIGYDRLVLATGSTPFVPDVPGLDLEGVIKYRTLEDVERIATRCRGAARAVIVGGGLLGIEAARAVQRVGCAVTVVERAPRLLPRQLDVEGASVLESKLRALDIDLRLPRSVESIRALDRGLEVALSHDERVTSEVVIFAAGIRPRDELARAAGLTCGRHGGVAVDAGMATARPDVFAIGECASIDETSYGLLAPCYAMAETLAARLIGDEATFEPPVASVRLKVDDITVAAIGDWLAEGPSVRGLQWLSQDRYRRIVVEGRRIVGAMAVGDGPDLPRIQAAVADGTALRAHHRRRFTKDGSLWREGAELPIERWPDAAVVCACTGVTCGTLRAALARGHRTRSALADATGASRVCGSCTPLIAALAGEAGTARRGPRQLGLGVASAVGVALLALAALIMPLPFAASIQAPEPLEFLWRSAWWKQATGFTLLGLCVASLLAVLRKRLRALRPGFFGSYRTVHAALGVGTIAGAVAHTGLRTGSNLTFALAVTFTVTLAFGLAAGIVTSIERRLPQPRAAKLRRGWTLAHQLVFWPMPVLVAFHIFAVYYF